MGSVRHTCVALGAALLLVACSSSSPSRPGPSAPGQPPPGTPPSAGVTITSGSTAALTGELIGTSGPRQGSEVVVTTSAPALPRPGATGVLYWVVDRPVAVFGPGTNLSLADVAVKQAQPGSVTLTIVRDSGPITVNGQRVNVVQAGIAVKLAYAP